MVVVWYNTGIYHYIAKREIYSVVNLWGETEFTFAAAYKHARSGEQVGYA